MAKYELWRSASQGSDSFFEAGNVTANRDLETDAKLICVIEAGSWNEAQQKRYDYMGWGHYPTIEEDAEGATNLIVDNTMTTFSNATIPNHPLVDHYLAACRDKTTPMAAFRTAVGHLAHFLAYECCRDWLAVRDTTVETPLNVPAAARVVDERRRVEIIPILRAGLAMVEGAQLVLPDSRLLHIGYRRDEETAQATCYLTRVPEKLPEDTRFLILEPMVASGGTLLQVFQTLIERGARPEMLRVISILASEPGLARLRENYGTVRIFCAGIDPELNEHAFIMPGLGDAGDRAFGTE